MAVWDFAPNHLVIENLPPEQAGGMQFNGWHFSSKPTVPWQYKFKVTLHGMKWFLQTGGLYDNTTSPTINARRFEEFIKTHGKWKVFTFPHPHLGSIECKFANLPMVPKGEPNSNGLIAAFEVELVHDNPAYV